MNKSELESLLRQAQTPEIPPDSLESFPRQVIGQLNRRKPDQPARRSFSFGLAVAGVLACAVLVFALNRGVGIKGPPVPQDSLASAKLIRETMAIFPNCLRAIVQDERGVNLIISESEDIPVSTPIYIRLCDGRHCSSLVTFSGQSISVAGQTLTVLSTPRGGIILTGDQFVWSNTQLNNEGNTYTIKASLLNSPAI